MGSTPAEQPNFFSLQIAEARRFHIDLNPPKDALLSVVSGGCEHCSADYEIHRASFPYFGIEFVTQGRGKLTLDGRSYDLVPGTVFAYGPGISQDIISDKRERLVKYFVDFTGKHAKRLLEQYGPRPGHVVQTSAPGEIIALFDELIRNGLRSTPFTPRIGALLIGVSHPQDRRHRHSIRVVWNARVCHLPEMPAWILDHADQVQTLEQIAAGLPHRSRISLPVVPPLRSHQPLSIPASIKNE